MEIDEQNRLDKIGECRAIITEHLDNPCVDNDQCEKRQEAEEQKCFNEFDELFQHFLELWLFNQEVGEIRNSESPLRNYFTNS